MQVSRLIYLPLLSIAYIPGVLFASIFLGFMSHKVGSRSYYRWLFPMSRIIKMLN